MVNFWVSRTLSRVWCAGGGEMTSRGVHVWERGGGGKEWERGMRVWFGHLTPQPHDQRTKTCFLFIFVFIVIFYLFYFIFCYFIALIFLDYHLNQTISVLKGSSSSVTPPTHTHIRAPISPTVTPPQTRHCPGPSLMGLAKCSCVLAAQESSSPTPSQAITMRY